MTSSTDQSQEPRLASPQAKSRPALQVPKHRLLLFRLVIVAVTVSLTLVLAEVGLRLAGVPPLQAHYGDPILGFTTERNRTDTFDFPEYGGKLTMRVNNLGFHEDSDTRLVKEPGTSRAIFIGDSQTAGECANFESYPNILETMLNRASNSQRHEIINAGTGRYSPYQYYVKAQTQLVQLNPDHLLVGIYLGNDFMDLMRQDDRPYLTLSADGKVAHHAPHFMVVDDPAKPPSPLLSLRLYGAFRRALGAELRYQISRAMMLYQDVTALGRGTPDVARYMLDVKRLTDISLGFMTQSLLQQVWFRRFPETLPVSFDFQQHVMKLFKQLCAEKGIRLTYVLIPTKLQIEPDEFRNVLDAVARYDPTMSRESLQAFENQLADGLLRQCAELQIEVVDLRAPLLERRADRRFYNPLEMHLTPTGNRAIAASLYEAIGSKL